MSSQALDCERLGGGALGREVPRKTSDRGIYANLATATLGSVAINSIRFLAHRQTPLCCRRPLANSALPAFSDLYHFVDAGKMILIRPLALPVFCVANYAGRVIIESDIGNHNI